MNGDSKKIFKAYVLAKNVEKQHVKENILQKYFDPTGYEKKRTFQGYLDLWQSFWTSRFSNESEYIQNSEKAKKTFEDFLNSRNWANPNIKKYKDAALEYYKMAFDDPKKIPIDEIENDVFEILLYGKTSKGWTPEQGKYRIIPKDTKKEEGKKPEITEPLTGIDPEEYKAMTPSEREEFHKKYYAKTADSKKTKLISTPKGKPPVKYKIVPR